MAETWRGQQTIHSASSSREYTVAEKVSDGVPTGTWGCNCPGWKAYGNCKHLKTMGLRSARAPIQPAPRGHGKGSNAAFGDAAYQHYNPAAEGFGSAADWIRIAEQMAGGRRAYTRPRRHTPSMAEDMALLGLTSMPADVKDLVRAYRRTAMRVHPDHNAGDPQAGERFKEVNRAYERLLAHYPR